MKKDTLRWLVAGASLLFLFAVPQDAQPALDILSRWHPGGNERLMEPYRIPMCNLFELSWLAYSIGAVQDSAQFPRSVEEHLASPFVLFWPINGLKLIEEQPPSENHWEIDDWLLPRGPGAVAVLLRPGGIQIHCVGRDQRTGNLFVRNKVLYYHTGGEIYSSYVIGDQVFEDVPLRPGQQRWEVLLSQMKGAIVWYARAEGKIPATPEVAARVIGKLVERNWTPEVREVWSVLVSRLKDLSGLPLDEGTTGSPTASGGNAEAPTGVTAPSTAPTTRFPLLP